MNLKITDMTLEKYYEKVLEKTKGQDFATKQYIRILWGKAYTIEEAINSINKL